MIHVNNCEERKAIVYKICLSEDDCSHNKQELERNLKIYNEVLRKVKPNDIESEAIDIRNKGISEGDALGGFIRMDMYKNKWENVSYRLLLAWTSMTYQLWEQQLMVLTYRIIELFKHEYFGFQKPENLNIEQFDCWKKIYEMRLLVNVIKHAEGDSAERLMRIRPDLFASEKSPIDGTSIADEYVLENVHTTIGIPSLNLSEEDLMEYTNELIIFWDEMYYNWKCTSVKC